MKLHLLAQSANEIVKHTESMYKIQVRQQGNNKLDVAPEANQCQPSNSDTDCWLAREERGG